MKGVPKPISASEQENRLGRVVQICKEVGFVGIVEYRHAYSRSGGAQYCIGSSAQDDIMIVYAEGFERDADPEDFDLEALIAHECGHQRLVRSPTLKAVFARYSEAPLEEVLASLIGAVLLGESRSARTLV